MVLVDSACAIVVDDYHRTWNHCHEFHIRMDRGQKKTVVLLQKETKGMPLVMYLLGVLTGLVLALIAGKIIVSRAKERDNGEEDRDVG